MLIVMAAGQIDTVRRIVTGPAGEQSLREKEARILEVLASHPDQVVSREDLFQDVFDYAMDSRSRTLVTTVARTRKALEKAGVGADPLQTVYGQGYRWVSAPSTPQEKLFGRRPEVARLRAALSDPTTRLLTLVGRGGIGKSTLVRHVVHGVSGVRSVELVDCSRTADIHRAVEDALGGDDVVFGVQSQGVRVLVLDNVEHVVEAVGLAVRAWLEAVPSLSIWCTSRRALGLPGETRLLVGPLGSEESQALFTARLPPGVRNEDARGVLELLGGHALSIELAAARRLVYSSSELRERLLLGRDVLRREGDHRQADVHEVIRQSLALLQPEAAEAIRQLAVVTGTFALARMEEVVDLPSRSVAAVLQELVEHHLVQRIPGPSTTFRLHEAVRSAAGEPCLAAAKRWVDIVARDQEAFEGGEGNQPARDELLAAAELALAQGWTEPAAVAVFGALHGFTRGRDPEQLRAVSEGLRSSTLSRGGQARAAIVWGWLERLRDPDHAHDSAEAAVRNARASRDDLLICWSLTNRAQVRATAGQTEDCTADLTEAAFRHRAADRLSGWVEVGLLEATTAIRRGDMVHAETALGSVVGDVVFAGFEKRFRSEQLWGCVLQETNRWPEAAQRVDQLVALAEEGEPEHRAWAALAKGYVLGCLGDPAEARPWFEEGVQHAGQAWLATRLHCNIAGMLAFERQWGEARKKMEQTLLLARAAGGRAERLALHRAAWLARISGDLVRGASWAARATAANASHLHEVTSEPLFEAQQGRLSEAIRSQLQVVDDLAGTSRLGEQQHAQLLLAELYLAAARFEDAGDVLRPLSDRVDVQPYEAPRLAVLQMAADGRPAPIPAAPDALSALHYLCWVALAYARAGDGVRAEALRAEVREAMAQDGLGEHSELGWRLRVSVI